MDQKIFSFHLNLSVVDGGDRNFSCKKICSSQLDLNDEVAEEVVRAVKSAMPNGILGPVDMYCAFSCGRSESCIDGLMNIIKKCWTGSCNLENCVEIRINLEKLIDDGDGGNEEEKAYAIETAAACGIKIINDGEKP